MGSTLGSTSLWNKDLGGQMELAKKFPSDQVLMKDLLWIRHVSEAGGMGEARGSK